MAFCIISVMLEINRIELLSFFFLCTVDGYTLLEIMHMLFSNNMQQSEVENITAFHDFLHTQING